METYHRHILASQSEEPIRVTNRMNIGIKRAIADGWIPMMILERVDSRFRGNDNHRACRLCCESAKFQLSNFQG